MYASDVSLCVLRRANGNSLYCNDCVDDVKLTSAQTCDRMCTLKLQNNVLMSDNKGHQKLHMQLRFAFEKNVVFI